jgi:cholesterol oxidase
VAITARRVVLAAGAIGSTELLLRNKHVHRTLPGLSDALGSRYTTNGDWITLMIPFRGAGLAWLAFGGAVIAVLLGPATWALPPLALYYLVLALAPRPFDPDVGTTNSDYVRFVGRKGENQGAYVESGRYPNPGKTLIAFLLSAVHAYTPRRYVAISRAAAVIRALVPPFGALARTWPIPLLTMGRDDAQGVMALDENGRVTIRYDAVRNRDYYRYASRLGRLVARAARARWVPNVGFLLFRRLEVPHNQGGVPMGATPADGVVDSCGRVFGHRNLMVLDSSIIPVSVRPNPALTILALAERAMARVVAQIQSGGDVAAEAPTKTPGP